MRQCSFVRREVKLDGHHVEDPDMMFKTASLAVLSLTALGTLINLYIVRRLRLRRSPSDQRRARRE
jgi:hypothetical protein